MYLIKDNRHGLNNYVFTFEDPKVSGFKGPVEEVELDYNLHAISIWPDGEPCPAPSLGHDPEDPNSYKMFKYPELLRSAGYLPVPGNPSVIVVASWKDYARLHQVPPDPAHTDDLEWYNYLDRVDEAARQRNRNEDAGEPPTGGNRDEIAAWVARQHLITDRSIREVWYLPEGAPREEIRLLEVNDRMGGPPSGVEPVDFGLDLDGTEFQLLVADISTDQLEQIKHQSLPLPPQWSLEKSLVWRRGA